MDNSANNDAPKRKREEEATHTENEENEETPVKVAKKNPADDLLCPISLELPLDPVTAQDGRVYERSAIAQHFGSASEKRSPMTNKLISTELLPAPQTKSLIESMVDNEIITGPLAENWKKRKQKQEAQRKLLEKAEAGDEDAMLTIGRQYCCVSDISHKNVEMGLKFLQKLSERGHADGSARLGRFYIQHGPNRSDGLLLLGFAAGQGSPAGAYYLADIYSRGSAGVRVNKTLAIHWYQRSLVHCPTYLNLSDEAKRYAQEKLQKLQSPG